jgi:hypothetical protein
MEKTITANISNQPKMRLCASCLICGEPVPLTEMEESALRYGHHIHSKVCDKCKAAILYMREQIS